MSNARELLLRIPLAKQWIESIYALQEEMDHAKSRFDMDDLLQDSFLSERETPEYGSVFTKKEPLVSVCIATYNRGPLLAERALRSIINQEYDNWECIVVGDCCTDETAELVASLKDSRIRFVNLPERGRYPTDPHLRWMVAGTCPVNKSLELAQGDFITHLDDDDEHSPDRIRKLLHHIQRNQLDFIWHPFLKETDSGRWQRKPCRRFRRFEITTSSVFYHHWLKRIPWDINAWRYREPGDWNRFRKFKYLQVRADRYPESLLKHYKERNQQST